MTDDIDPDVLRRLADMHAVYRMFDAVGRLLYIGRTGDAGRRFGSHNSKRWFPLVATIALEWFATEAAAALAEQRAIIKEHPRYNLIRTRALVTRKRMRTASQAAGPMEECEYPLDDLAAAVLVRADLASGAARARREAARVSAADIARVVGVSRQSVSSWEMGRDIPDVRHAATYGRALAALTPKAALRPHPATGAAGPWEPFGGVGLGRDRPRGGVGTGPLSGRGGRAGGGRGARRLATASL